MTAIQPAIERAHSRSADLLPARIFLLVAPLIFAAYALLTPPFQTFDENQHLYRAWQIASLQLTAERRGAESGGSLPPGLEKATLQEIGSVVPQGERKAMVRPLSAMFSLNTSVGAGRPHIFYNFFGAAVYSPVGYVPQVIAVDIGRSTGFSVEWIVRLGRLLNSALCILLIWWALVQLPFGRWAMAIVAFLPPTAAGAASFGQDGLVIGAAFLLTALGLRTAVEHHWTPRRVLISAIAAIAVTLSKFVYLPLVAVPLLPKPRAIPSWRWAWPPLLIGSLAALLAVAWMRINAHSIVSFLPSLPSPSEHVFWIVQHPLGYAALVARTYAAMLPVLWAGFYRFGDSTVPIDVSAAVAGTAALLLILIHGDDHATGLTRARRAWMLSIAAIVAVLIASAIFVSFTRLSAAYIPSIQARYFVPILPLTLVALMRKGEKPSLPALSSALALTVVAQLLALGRIVRTFYTF